MRQIVGSGTLRIDETGMEHSAEYSLNLPDTGAAEETWGGLVQVLFDPRLMWGKPARLTLNNGHQVEVMVLRQPIGNGAIMVAGQGPLLG